MKVQGQQQVQFAFMFCAVEAKTHLIWQCLCMIPKMDKLAFRYNHLKHLMKACTKWRYKSMKITIMIIIESYCLYAHRVTTVETVRGSKRNMKLSFLVKCN